MIIVIPLAGELKFYPFNNTFRITFGIPIFFLLLLWIRRIPLILCGFIVGISVVVFRMTLACFLEPSLSFRAAFILHIPAFFYYMTYCCLFYFVKVKKLHHRPLLVGLLSIFIETTSSMVELTFRHFTLGDKITLYTISEIIIIAIIRSFFALSFFYIIKLREAELAANQQQRQNRHMLLLISNLYAESIQLKKSLQNAEEITRDCYTLYRTLQDQTISINTEEFTEKILGFAGRVHDIKKDNQRIYAGLAKMISEEKSTDYMNPSEIGSIILQTNKNYAHSLGKNIKFVLKAEDFLPPLHVFTILSLINNLVSNAVEAIKDTGIIKISICKINDFIEFRVSDNGVGIPEKKMSLIFQPGYTTKYDSSGTPSTGIGLSYVKEVVLNLKGRMDVHTEPMIGETVFIIQLPIQSLTKEGW